jgi:ABC-2 type transport system permease protein
VPRFDAYGSQGFPAGNDRGVKLLGVAVEGRFPSYFQGKDSPLLQAAQQDKNSPAPQKPEAAPRQVAGVIDRSPESARIILFGSSDFLSDQTGQQDLGALQLVNNSLDWALADPGLLSIRGRGYYARTLVPLSRETQAGVESLDYGLTLLGLLLVFAGYQLARRRTQAHYRKLLQGRA